MTDKKVIDFKKTVYELANEHPEFIPIMAANGFPEIALPGMTSTAGRFMTVPKGAKMKGLNFDDISKAFADSGFEVVE
ncbi:MAG TPA: hypothetical protein DCM45_02015 [Clostridiales bacterium]|nr:hypothetical protein [Clostridiales bacterium]